MNFRSVSLIYSLAQLNGFYTIYTLSKQRKTIPGTHVE